MRRLLRILLNAATVLSLVLCMVTVAAWVRSYQARDSVWWTTAKPRLELEAVTYRGGLIAGFARPVGTWDGWRLPGAGWNPWPAQSYAEMGAPQGTLSNRLGFALYHSQNRWYEWRHLACPYWFIVLLTAILPAARLAGWRRRARRLRLRPGLCQHCGYDCRATPDRCPECGRVRAAALGASGRAAHDPVRQR